MSKTTKTKRIQKKTTQSVSRSGKKTALRRIAEFANSVVKREASKSTSYSQVLRKLGVYVNGRNINAIRQRVFAL